MSIVISCHTVQGRLVTQGTCHSVTHVGLSTRESISTTGWTSDVVVSIDSLVEESHELYRMPELVASRLVADYGMDDIT